MNSEESSPWMCHVCGYSSTVGEGVACNSCYKICCHQHMTVATLRNPKSGLYELQQVCVECQFKKHL